MNDRLPYSEDVLALNPELQSVVQPVSKPASKYHNVRTESKGLRFDSGHEAAEITKLIVAEEHKSGVFALRLQVRFPLPGNIIYVADAVYLDEKLQPHIIDCKGKQTYDSKLKFKLFKETYGQGIELI